MINLTFTFNREPIRIVIDGTRIIYFDRKWEKGVPFMPKDESYIKQLLTHQRQFPLAKQIVEWIQEANSGKNFEEYSLCKTEEEVATIVKKDALSKGLLEVK